MAQAGCNSLCGNKVLLVQHLRRHCWNGGGSSQLWVVVQHFLKHQVPHILLCELRILKVKLKGSCRPAARHSSSSSTSLVSNAGTSAI